MKLQFKFRGAVPETARLKQARTLIAQGAKSVRRLFPKVTDSESTSLYIVEVEEESAGKKLLDLLQATREVEFVEPEARRKLIH